MPEPHNAADEQSVSDQKARLGRRQKRIDEGLKTILATQNGRLWFWDMLSACHCFATPFRPGQDGVTHFNLGEQNIGLRLLADLMRVSPDSYITMTKENADA